MAASTFAIIFPSSLGTFSFSNRGISSPPFFYLEKFLHLIYSHYKISISLFYSGLMVIASDLRLSFWTCQNLKEAEAIIDLSIDESWELEQLELLRLKAILQVEQEELKGAVETYKFLLSLIKARREKQFWYTHYELHRTLAHAGLGGLCAQRRRLARPGCVQPTVAKGREPQFASVSLIFPTDRGRTFTEFRLPRHRKVQRPPLSINRSNPGGQWGYHLLAGVHPVKPFNIPANYRMVYIQNIGRTVIAVKTTMITPTSNGR
ncbi:hypothetical protein KSP39_PZI002383 [Platanthera zijinensis]|uniref:Uncharacterized protein n=1 Tax=Platanthera zijinensis TaxID=2320716 RepID=A0AAP0BZ78_9ASPA